MRHRQKFLPSRSLLFYRERQTINNQTNKTKKEIYIMSVDDKAVEKLKQGKGVRELFLNAREADPVEPGVGEGRTAGPVSEFEGWDPAHAWGSRPAHPWARYKGRDR